MPDYAYYTGPYYGSRIPEADFPRLMQRAQAALRRFDRCCCVTGGEESRSLALCAMAEVLWEAEHRQGITAKTVGNVSVRYADDKCADRTLWRALYRQAAVYLDICRGIGR